MTEPASCPGRLASGAGLLSIAALAVSVVALVRVGAQSRSAERAELRSAIVNLQEEMTANRQAPTGRGSAAQSWVYYMAASKLAKQIPEDVSAVDYLILANFALSHSDLPAADQYIADAQASIQQDSSPVRQALGRMALGHIHFEHAPKTDAEQGRAFYRDALAQLAAASEKARIFVEAGIHLEWALDEYAAGDEKNGDAQLAELDKALGDAAVSERYRRQFNSQAEGAVIEAKVQGGLL